MSSGCATTHTQPETIKAPSCRTTKLTPACMHGAFAPTHSQMHPLTHSLTHSLTHTCTCTRCRLPHQPCTPTSSLHLHTCAHPHQRLVPIGVECFLVQLLDIGFFHSGKNTLCSRMSLVVMVIVLAMAVEYCRALQEKGASMAP